MKSPFFLSLGLIAFLATGCTTEYIEIDRTVPPYYHARNVYRNTTTPNPFPQRVLVLPCYGVGTPASLRDLNEALVQEAVKANLFEVIPPPGTLTKNRRRSQEYDLVEAQTAAKEFGADGILICRVTSCQPYKPLTLGVAVKLWNIPKETTAWAVDENFDSSLTTVANGARNYYLTKLRVNYPNRRSEQILDSPQLFFQYVFAEIFSTLPKEKSDEP
jgi:hypothetical protein